MIERVGAGGRSLKGHVLGGRRRRRAVDRPGRHGLDIVGIAIDVACGDALVCGPRDHGGIVDAEVKRRRAKLYSVGLRQLIQASKGAVSARKQTKERYSPGTNALVTSNTAAHDEMADGDAYCLAVAQRPPCILANMAHNGALIAGGKVCALFLRQLLPFNAATAAVSQGRARDGGGREMGAHA